MLCPIHNVEFKVVPAGFSKVKKNPDGTPKAYSAFYACPIQGCTQKPPKVVQDALKTSPIPTSQVVPTNEIPDWDAIGHQKNRSNLMASLGAAMIAKNGAIDWSMLDAAELWVTKEKPLTDAQENEVVPF